MKKSLYIFCDYYWPGTKAGGPLRSISAIVNALKNIFSITIITRNHDLCDTTPYPSVISDQVMQQDGYQIIYCSRENTLSNIKKLLKNSPDIIYLNSFFSPYFSVIPQYLLRFTHSKPRVIISPRGELGFGALSIKPIRKKWYSRLFKLFNAKDYVEFLTASDSERKEVAQLFSQKFKTAYIDNLSVKQSTHFELSQKNKNQLKIIFVSRISRKKNLSYAIQSLQNVQGDVQLDIYGLMEDKLYWESCERLIVSLSPNVRVQYYGEIHPDQVIATMQQYYLFFMPTKNENYGYVIVEALAAGCPVLLSDQTPWKNIAENNDGWTLPLSDITLFSETINTLPRLCPNEYQQYKIAARNYYNTQIQSHSNEEKYVSFFESST